MTRHQMLMSLLLKTARLPAEFQEVEWIGSSGTQYIDTGYIPSNLFTIEYNATVTSIASFRNFVGFKVANAFHLQVSRQNDYFRVYYNSGDNNWADISSVPILNVNHTIVASFNDGKLYIDGVNKRALSILSYPTNSLIIFGGESATNVLGSMDLSYFKVYDENYVLVRDLVPCYRKLDGVIGAYDLVTGVFFPNAGTGTFTKGANV